MAHDEFDGSNFNPPLFLNPNEQDLLLTALNSNKPGVVNLPSPFASAQIESPKPSTGRANSTPKRITQASTGQDVYTSPLQQAPGSGSLNELGFDESPYIDYDLDESNFDWDANGEMFGALPGQTPGQEQAGTPDEADEEESGDKRKNQDDGEDEEGGGKRREGDDKNGKKPGRKPLTSEPTTKRKAQNRAAQRAFRERKERHLKELETKVEDLEKASESTNHENGLLRAQVERLQTELREYRKRLSFSNPALNRTSPQSASFGLSSKSNWDINNNFQFAFPKFGIGLPSPTNTNPLSQLIRTNSVQSGTGKPDSSKSSPSSAVLPNQTFFGTKTRTSTGTSMEELNGLFSPSILANASSPDYMSYPSTNSTSVKSPATANQTSQTPNERALSESNTESPASSGYQNGFSSCVTTPESSAESPEQRKASEAAFNSIAEQAQRRKSSSHEAFCKDFQTACGNKINPVPPMISDSDKAPASVASTANQPKTPSLETSGVDAQGIDWFASQNGGSFDPELFGDYRDPQESVMNSDLGGFFNDAFAVPDFNSPVPVAQDSATPKKQYSLMKEIEDRQAGKEGEVVPGDAPKQFLTCNMLWDRVQRSQLVQSGEADMDDLCSQLKSKAKCSGNGAVIDQKDVDAILGPAPDNTKDFFKMFR